MLDLLKHKIDFSQLEALLKARTGVKSLQLQGEVFESQHRFRMNVRSNNLKDQCGIMECVYKEVQLQDFGSGFDKDTNLFNVTINFRYQIIDGGSNGLNVGTYLYNVETKQWSVPNYA